MIFQKNKKVWETIFSEKNYGPIRPRAIDLLLRVATLLFPPISKKKLSYAKCSKNQVPDEYSDSGQWEMSLCKGKKLRLRRSRQKTF